MKGNIIQQQFDISQKFEGKNYKYCILPHIHFYIVTAANGILPHGWWFSKEMVTGCDVTKEAKFTHKLTTTKKTKIT